MLIARKFARIFIAVGVLAAAGAAHSQTYRSLSCGELWVERNSIYKANGYCFNTQRGISYFGNAGCQVDDVRAVPLSHANRARIAAIAAAERAKGCS